MAVHSAFSVSRPARLLVFLTATLFVFAIGAACASAPKRQPICFTVEGFRVVVWNFWESGETHFSELQGVTAFNEDISRDSEAHALKWSNIQKDMATFTATGFNVVIDGKPYSYQANKCSGAKSRKSRPERRLIEAMEATGGFEPPHRGFADLPLRPLGYVALGWGNAPSSGGPVADCLSKIPQTTKCVHLRASVPPVLSGTPIYPSVVTAPLDAVETARAYFAITPWV